MTREQENAMYRRTHAALLKRANKRRHMKMVAAIKARYYREHVAAVAKLRALRKAKDRLWNSLELTSENVQARLRARLYRLANASKIKAWRKKYQQHNSAGMQHRYAYRTA